MNTRPMRIRGARSRASVTLGLLVLAILVFALVYFLWPGGRWHHDPTGLPTPSAVSPHGDDAAFVSNETCLGCHTTQAQEWRSSHHAQAMAKPTPSSVRGDFGGREFKHAGVTTRFLRRGDQYIVRTQGVDGRVADFEVRYTFGVEPLQQYLITMPGGRFQALGVAWDDQRKQWFQLRPDEKTPPGDVLHWTGRYQTANTLCIVCHTTGYERRYDAPSDSFDSRWHEPNVSCQACHGPGSEHLKWAQASASEKAKWSRVGPVGLPVKLGPKGGSATQEMCTPCHARRSELTAQHRPGQPLLDHFVPALLREGLYHPDGQQQDEVFVDGSFRQSKMFQRGVTCSHCHNPHTGSLRQRGNTLCLQCHSTQHNTEFPGAAGDYDSSKHHFHKDGSPGAQCVNCHMPSKVYMGIQPRPDHSLRVPRPDLSVQTGVPNACNACHTKESAAWAAARVAQWYGPGRRQEAHYGTAFARYRAQKSGAAQALVAIIADAAAAPIVRATALDALRTDGVTGLPIRIAALSDPSAEVRVAAADGLATMDPRRRMEVLGPLLNDPLRAIRLAAVLSLSTIASSQMEPALQVSFDRVLKETIAVHSLALDMPAARLNLAVVYENTGQIELAQQHYHAALKLDPDFTPARLNLARLLAALGRAPDALDVLKVGLARVPLIGEMQYSMGLLLAQHGQMAAAIEALQTAARLLPHHARVHYNLGLAYQLIQRGRAAEEALLTAAKVDDTDPDVVYALAAFYFQAKRYDEVRRWVDRLQSAHPHDPRLASLQRALAVARGQ